MKTKRSTADVFEDHLRCRQKGEIEKDLEQNYSPDVVFLCEHGSFRGRDAVRKSAEELATQLPDGQFQYIAQVVEEEYAYVQWRAYSAMSRVENGADTFAIRGGRIVMQSVYYELKTNS
jgi:hypothetical protein